MKTYPLIVENLLRAKTVCFFHHTYQENRAGRVVKTQEVKVRKR